MAEHTETILDARAVERTLRRMADEIVEPNDGTDDLDHRRHSAPRRAARRPDRVVDHRLPRSATFRAARSTSRSIATTCRPSGRDPSSARPICRAPSTARTSSSSTTCSTPAAPIRAALDELADFGRPSRIVARGAHRPRRPRAADPARHRRQDGRGRDRRPRRRAGRRARRTRRAVVMALEARMSVRAALGKDLLGLEPLTGEQIQSDSRHRRAVQGNQRARDQESADAARLDDRQSLLRSLDAHAHLVRVRGEATVGRHRERRRERARACRKGETLVDTARNLEAMRIDMVVIRHGSSGAAPFLAERIESNVINAGDGTHEHPTQGLLDLLTLRDNFGRSKDSRSASAATCCTRASRARTSGA